MPFVIIQPKKKEVRKRKLLIPEEKYFKEEKRVFKRKRVVRKKVKTNFRRLLKNHSKNT